MVRKSNITGTAEAWESGALGRDEAHVRRAPESMERALDDALGLQAISIRLPKGVIETYKMLANLNGVGYQPLMRDALCRFAESEMKQLLIGATEQQRQTKAHAKKEEKAAPPARPMKKAA